MAQHIHCVSLFAIFIILLISTVERCIATNEDLVLSSKEKQILEELKMRVSDAPQPEYMKEDIYLINWVRVADLNVNKAEQMFRDNLKWREELKVDGIQKEEFPRFDQDFPFDVSNVDFNGTPILIMHFGEWDVRKAHLTGYRDKLYRYLIKGLEITTQRIRDAQKEGKEVTRFHVVFDMAGFNLVQHYCLQCATTYNQFFKVFQNHYPAMVDNLIFINSPAAFQVLQSFGTSSKWHKTMKIFGNDKREWRKYLLNIIPQDRLDRSLGGDN